MARTANRYRNMLCECDNGTKVYRAGNYLRLSIDSDYTGSDSLENQRKLAKEYVNQVSDLVIVKEYIDNGKTGTNFERPAFSRMIADLKQKEINCIIVKDLSRFGREYIEAGNYIEKVFPFLGVRFISIVDRYDSSNPECEKELLLISLKNLMSEMYARDISKKVGSTFQIKQEKGIFYRSAIIPYGYKMSQIDEQYCVDEAAAAVVKQIFLLYSQGISKYAICQYLYHNRILTPMQYNQTGRIYQNEEDILKIWQLSTIDRILKNSVYIGNVWQHKTEQSFFDGKQSTNVPESERKLLIKNHPPIITEALFLDVQNRLQQKKEKYASFKSHSDSEKETTISETNVFQGKIFQGKVFCGNCKAVMTRTAAYHTINGNQKKYKLFQCSTYRKISGCCDFKTIEEKVLSEILYLTIQKHLALLKGLKQLLNRDMDDSFKGKLQNIKYKTEKIINRKVILEQEYMQVYAQYAADELPLKDFQKFRQCYMEKEKSCEDQKKKLEVEEKKIEKYKTSIKKMFSEWMEYDYANQLTTDIIQNCIERIEIFQENRIEVTLCYQDCFELIERWMQK